MRTVIFDLGETLVDETRLWETVACATGVPTFTLSAMIGAAIQGKFDPYVPLGIQRVTVAEHGFSLQLSDFYPDAIPTLQQLQELGYPLGIVANQPHGIAEQLQAMGLPLDILATSATYGVAKPDPAFFQRIVADCQRPADQIIYVGDRLDNDIFPAQAAGMQAVFLRRGPWGFIQARWPEAADIRYRIDSLAELPGILAELP